MSRRRRRSPGPMLAVCALVTLAVPLDGQQRGTLSEPPRPRLSATADTNDAGAYYRHALTQLRINPKQAAEGFYWVTRIEPSRQDAVYARRIALLLQDSRRLKRYMDGDRPTVRSPEMRSADSLYLRSLMMNPFMLREHDRLLLDGYAAEWAREIELRTGARDAGALRHAIDTYMRTASPFMRAWFAYTHRNYDLALRDYNEAIRRSRNKAWLHAERAHIFYLTGRIADAETEMRAAITESRKRDEKQVVHFYDSKALYEYSLGYALHTAGRNEEALEAYGRALQEDLSYYPAHSRTASILLARGDTAGAVGSLALAASIETVDAYTRVLYATLLVATGDAAGAEAQLSTLIELEPYFARAYAERGHALEALGKTDEAIAAYTEFLDRAARNDSMRRAVTARLNRLRSAAEAEREP